MNEIEAKSLLRESLDLFFKALSPEFADQVRAHRADPTRLCKPKTDTDYWHIRILPAVMLPKKFWAAGACFYELGIGQNGGSALECSTCALRMWGSSQKGRGGGFYKEPINRVIKRAETVSEGTFESRTVGAAKMLCCPFRGEVDPKAMAEKMKWLVEHTLKEIQAVPSL